MEQIVKYLKERKFVNTQANFLQSAMSHEEFVDMFCDPENISWQSPTSETKYVLTPTHRLYRFSNEWGKISNGCVWRLGGVPKDSKHTWVYSGVGICDIDDIEDIEDIDDFTPISQYGAQCN